MSTTRVLPPVPPPPLLYFCPSTRGNVDCRIRTSNSPHLWSVLPYTLASITNWRGTSADAIDIGSNKSAIVSCNKILKKHPDNDLVKVRATRLRRESVNLAENVLPGIEVLGSISCAEGRGIFGTLRRGLGCKAFKRCNVVCHDSRFTRFGKTYVD